MDINKARKFLRAYGATLGIGVIFTVQFPSICGTAYIRAKFPASPGGLLAACKYVRDYNQDIGRPLPNIQ